MLLWERLSEKHREILMEVDAKFGENYWQKMFSKEDMGISDIDIHDWFLLEKDLGFKTINEAYHNMFNNEA